MAEYEKAGKAAVQSLHALRLALESKEWAAAQECAKQLQQHLEILRNTLSRTNTDSREMAALERDVERLRKTADLAERAARAASREIPAESVILNGKTAQSVALRALRAVLSVEADTCCAMCHALLMLPVKEKKGEAAGERKEVRNVEAVGGINEDGTSTPSDASRYCAAEAVPSCPVTPGRLAEPVSTRRQSFSIVQLGTERFHAQCLQCHTCGCNLDGQAVVSTQDGHVCQGCAPLCQGCGERLDSGAYVVCLQLAYHRRCLKCAFCSETLLPSLTAPVFTRDDRPACLPCVQSEFAPRLAGALRHSRLYSRISMGTSNRTSRGAPILPAPLTSHTDAKVGAMAADKPPGGGVTEPHTPERPSARPRMLTPDRRGSASSTSSALRRCSMFSVYAPAPNLNDAAVLQEYAVYGTALDVGIVNDGSASVAGRRQQKQHANSSGGDVSSGQSGIGGTGGEASTSSGGSSSGGSSSSGSSGSGDEEGAAHDALYSHASASSDADLGVVGAKQQWQRRRRRRRSSRRGDRFNLDTLIESDASCARLLDYCAQQPKMLEPLLLWMDLEQFSSLPPTTSAAEVGRTARAIVRKYLSSHSDLPVSLAEHVRHHAIAAVAAFGAEQTAKEVAADDSSTDGGRAARDQCDEPPETAQSEEAGPALNVHAAQQLVYAFGQLRHATRRHIEARVLPYFGAAMAAGHLESAAARASSASAATVPRLAPATAPAGDLPLAGSTPPMVARPLPPLPPRPWSAKVIDYKTMAGFDWRRPLKTSYVAYIIEVEVPVEGKAAGAAPPPPPPVRGAQARATTRTYTIRRRFREFWGLHQLLASKLPNVDLAAFPRRLEGLRPGAAEGLRAKRSEALTTYLASVLAAAPCWHLEGVQSFIRPRLDDCVEA